MSYILGIAYNGTDSAACIFNNKILLCAVEEERFSRLKHDNSFPEQSISSCLEFAGISANDISKIAVSWDYNRYLTNNDNSVRFFYKSLESNGFKLSWKKVNKHIEKFVNWGRGIKNKLISLSENFSSTPIQFFDHHKCHAASSFFYSGFKRCLTFVIDDQAESETTSIYLCEKKDIKLIDSIAIPNSIGLFYAGATQFLGLMPFYDEGTFMALSTTGMLNRELKEFIDTEVLIRSHDSFYLNTEMISKPVFNYSRDEKILFTKKMIYELARLKIITPKSFKNIDQKIRNYAFTIQRVFEEIIYHLIKSKIAQYSIFELCLAGGVAQNCTVNGKILNTFYADAHNINLFVPPWCNDSGGAIGAGLLACYEHEAATERHNIEYQLKRADWGLEYNDSDITKAIEGLSYKKSSNIAQEAAKLLSEGKIIGWFQGRCEFGPRALGNRSLLSHPGIVENKNRLQRIKQRLEFRPFAPSILTEHVNDYVSSSKGNLNFMNIALTAKISATENLPQAINLPDRSLRIQSVERIKGWLYREMLEEFYKITKIPAVLNTSYNICEPLVLTPKDAVSTFMKSLDIDYLVIGDYIVTHS